MTDQTNYIKNGTFENNINDWDGGMTFWGTNPAILTRSSTVSHSGNYSMRVQIDTSGDRNSFIIGQSNSMPAGKIYRYSAWLYIPTGGPDVRVEDIFRYASTYFTKERDKWVYMEGFYGNDVEPNQALCLVAWGQSIPTGSYFYVDDVEVKEMDWGKIIVEGEKKPITNVTAIAGGVKKRVEGAAAIVDSVKHFWKPFVPHGSQEFEYTGAMETLIVPDGVYQIEAELWGAQGGKGSSWDYWDGGLGYHVIGTLAVTPGYPLYVFVGGEGGIYEDDEDRSGGWNGGGDAGEYDSEGPGGGATDIRQGGTSLAERAIVAGAGGGAAYDDKGGDGGGDKGQDGKESTAGSGGKGGSQTRGGKGGAGDRYDVGKKGTLGKGGEGSEDEGSGGGAGLWGGGGGGEDGGAGGGSSDISGVSNGQYIAADRLGNGKAILRW